MLNIYTGIQKRNLSLVEEEAEDTDHVSDERPPKKNKLVPLLSDDEADMLDELGTSAPISGPVVVTDAEENNTFHGQSDNENEKEENEFLAGDMDNGVTFRFILFKSYIDISL